jgi:feruloyl esterase
MPGITVTSSVSVAAGSFKLPGSASAVPPVQVPAFCRITATVNRESPHGVVDACEVESELLSVGNGGLAGSISYAPMVKPLQQGYATSSTDTGHQGASTPMANGRSETTSVS